MPPLNRKKLGAQGEEIAAELLEQRGIVILARNFRTRRGEIDIIAEDGEDIVFIEVKLRRTDSAGLPEEAIDEKKQEQIRKIAEVFLSQKGWMERPVRFDVMAISRRKENDRWNARWIKKAF